MLLRVSTLATKPISACSKLLGAAPQGTHGAGRPLGLLPVVVVCYYNQRVALRDPANRRMPSLLPRPDCDGDFIASSSGARAPFPDLDRHCVINSLIPSGGAYAQGRRSPARAP